MDTKITNHLEQSMDQNNTTSPSQLQEVTLDPDATNNFSYMGMRSPGAPTNGRSVKEIDEQLTNLKKENFNLKLRIYFLEERMGTNFNIDKEDAIKKNIELQIQLQNVQKELEDKEELLCQAAKAMEIEEEEKRKEILSRDKEISELRKTLNDVRTELQNEIESREERQQIALCAQAFDLDIETDDTKEVILNLQTTVKNLQQELKKERKRADHFESVLELAENTQVRCSNLESRIEDSDSKLHNLTIELQESESRLLAYKLRVNTIEEELHDKNAELQNTTAQLKIREHELKENHLKMKELSRKLEVLLTQKDKSEKRADKYISQVEDLESKNCELQKRINNLESQYKSLKIRWDATVDEVKRTNNRTENVPHVEQEESNTDAALFSVQNLVPVSEAQHLSKISPKVSISQKSLQHGSSHSPSKNSNSNSSSNTGESVHRVPSYSKSSSSLSEICSAMQLTREEYFDLRQSHFKACKIIKIMIKKEQEKGAEISKLTALINEKEKEMQSLQEKISELSGTSSSASVTPKKKSIQEKVSEMTVSVVSNPTANLKNSMAADEMHLVEQYKELACELEKKIEILNATLEQKDSQVEKLKTELQEKTNRIIDLEFELLALNEGITNLDSSSEKEDVGTEKLIQEKYEKEKQIQKLENALRKRTYDLQTLVNKELWEQNRSIEKLQTIVKTKDHEIAKLEKNMYGKDLQLKVLKEKINELGVHVNLPPGLITVQECSQIAPFESAISVEDQLKFCLEERKHFMKEIEELQIRLQNTPEHDENRQMLQLQNKYKDLCDELEKSEKLRLEAQDICSVLNTRLEELCYFLDSLLKQKSVLGFLGNEQTRKVQRIIDKSLDLSRTLSANMTLNADQSLLQLSDITNLLNATRNDSMNFSNIFAQNEELNAILSIIPSDITLTYQSHLSCADNNEQAQVIRVLREQVTNLKNEIELRDIELSKKLVNESDMEEKPLKDDEEFINAVVDLHPKSSTQVHPPEIIFQGLVEDVGKLNVTSSTLLIEKSATSTTLKNHRTENQSESESWSEPDRTVSMARIGILDESIKRPSIASSNSRRYRLGETSDMSTDSTEDEHMYNLSRTPSKRTTLAESRQTVIALHEQICELEVKLKDKENQLLAAQVAYYETDNLLKNEQIKREEIKKQLIQLKEDFDKRLEEIEKQKFEAENKAEEANQKFVDLTSEVKDMNKKLEEAEACKKQAEEKISELQQIVNTLEEFRQNAEKTMVRKDKEMHNTLNELEIEKTKAINALHTTEELLQKAKEDVQIAEKELQSIHEREQKLREDLENNYQKNLKNAEEQYLNNVKTIERNYEAQANKCREAVVQIKASYEKDYIKKTEVEQRALRIEEITKEVENLKSVIQDCDTKIQMMAKKEIELTNKIQSLHQAHAEKIYELQQELDNATLQYSEEILEKTKLKNENENLKEHLHKFNEKELELIKEVQKVHDDFQNKTVALQAAVSKLEHQKSTLESKISDMKVINAELQLANADIRNRLTRLQINKSSGEPVYSTSLPTCPENAFDFYPNRSMPINIQSSNLYTRQSSDHSGYTSEDVPPEEAGSKNVSSYVQAAIQSIFGVAEEDHERIHANASPDLGIESDHGRFSSLEANVNIPRPLLPTLELTQSMSNLLDPVQDVTCANDDCCKRTKQIANENVDLRRRLLRTRRALEETLNRLTLANKHKKEVEKSICRQIHKTSQVLRKAKANLDSGSETDILKK